jgi:hypothetical protein
MVGVIWVVLPVVLVALAVVAAAAARVPKGNLLV